MYFLYSEKANNSINLPTSLSEITPTILNNLTKDVNLSEHYSIVALIHKTSLFNIAANVAGGKLAETISIIPVIAKSSITATASDAKDCSVAPVKGQTLLRPIIAPSVIERGFELYIPTAASVNNVCKFINNDESLRRSLYSKTYNGNVIKNGIDNPSAQFIATDNDTKVYILGFKIIANNDIVATVPLKYTLDNDPYNVSHSNKEAQ